MSPRQKLFPVVRLPQGLRGDGPDLRLLEPRQPLGEAGQAVPAALHGIERQVAVAIQSVALADRFLDVFRAVDPAMIKAANFKAKAVRSQVHSREQCSVLHV